MGNFVARKQYHRDLRIQARIDICYHTVVHSDLSQVTGNHVAMQHPDLVCTAEQLVTLSPEIHDTDFRIFRQPVP